MDWHEELGQALDVTADHIWHAVDADDLSGVEPTAQVQLARAGIASCLDAMAVAVYGLDTWRAHAAAACAALNAEWDATIDVDPPQSEDR